MALFRLILPPLMAAFSLAAFAQTTVNETRTTLDDQTGVAVTIYNENLALVRDQRSVTLAHGRGALAVRDVSAMIRPETALLTSLDGNLRLLEQNFDYDLLSPNSLLEKFVGRSVRAVTVNPANGNETIETADVLATNNGVVLRFEDRIETGFPGRLIFDEVPANLRDRPTLVLDLENATEGPQRFELSYLTRGLGWKADYVASLNDDETRFDLNGWVTLNNNSGTTYNNALLQLVAGDVQQVREAMPRLRSAVMMEAAAAPAADMMEESLLDYHLYTLQRPTTLSDQQSKQVALLGASDVPVEKRYIVKGQGQFFGGRSTGSLKQDVGVFIALTNDEDSNLGLPLPAGIVRVYKNDSAGRIQFVGEDRIDHTPRNEDLLLKLGNAFDVTAERVQTTFKKVASRAQYNFSAEVGQKITLSNARDDQVEVRLQELLPGDWQVLAQTHIHEQLSSGLLEWIVSVPAGGSAELEYVALIRY